MFLHALRSYIYSPFPLSHYTLTGGCCYEGHLEGENETTTTTTTTICTQSMCSYHHIAFVVKEKLREEEREASEKREENKIYYSLLELKICIKYNKVAAGAVKRNNFHF